MADEEDQVKPQEQQDDKLIINYIKRWFKFFRSHRQLPLAIPFPQTTQFSMDSQSYIFFLHRVDGLPRSQNTQTTLAFKVVANLFMAGEFQKNSLAQAATSKSKCFFGRTYESPPISIDFQPDGSSYHHQPIQIYYHTKVTGQSSPLILLIELLLIEMNQDIMIRRQSLGWIECSATSITNAPQKLLVRRGSPRVLLNTVVPQHETTQFATTIELMQSQAFQVCNYLIPENVLVGYMDEIPGIVGNFVQGIQGLQDEVISLAPTFTIYLSQIQVLVPESIDSEVYKQVQRYRSYKFRVNEDYRGDINIINKRLVVGFHNGWTVINSRGLSNYVPLSDSRITHTEGVGTKSIHFKALEYQGVIDVNNVTVTPLEGETISYNFGVLILQLEYEAQFLVANIGKQTMQIIIGWLPLYIGDKIGSNNEFVEDEMICGPGKTVNGKPLAQFMSSDIPIKINANLNLQGISAAEIQQMQLQQRLQQKTNQDIKQAAQTQQPKVERFKQTGGQNDDQINIKAQLKLREQDALIQKLKEENERLKQGVGPIVPQYIDETQSRSRELEYLKAIEKLREENRIAQLSTSKQFEDLENIIKIQQKSFQQTQPQLRTQEDFGDKNILFDRTDFSKYRPIIDQSVRTYPLPQSTLRPISKADTAFLLQTGIPGLLDGDPEDSDLTAQELEQRALKLEMEDERKDSVIIIQLLAMKIYFNSEELLDITQLGFRVPQKLFFTLHFFDLPQYQTPPLILEFANDTRILLTNLRNNTPLRILSFHDQTTHNVKFTIDTATVRYNNLQGDFVQYLYRRCLLIDVWDADTKLLFGSMKVPLRTILRQGKSSQHLLKEVDILDTNFKIIKGSIQILIRNIGRIPSTVNPDLNQKDARLLTKSLENQEKQQTHTSTKRKIISEKTAPLQQESDQNQESQAQDQQHTQEDRISLRIKKLKIQNLSQINDKGNTQTQTRKLTEFQKYKEQQQQNSQIIRQKPKIVKQIVSDLLSNHKILNTFFGRAEIVPYQITNNFNQPFTFQATVEDPDAKYLNIIEFQGVTNPAEWKFWCHVRQFPEPYAFDMFKYKESDPGKRTYYFYLEAGESVTLLFKFISFRIVDASLQFEQDAIDTAILRGKDFIEKYLYPRNIQVYFSRVPDNSMIDGFRIQIEPHMQVVDHVLRFYERDNRSTKITLPPLYSFVQPPEQKPIIHVTDPNVILEWGKDNREIKLCLRVGSVCSITKFNVLAYTDSYAAEVVGNWQIEVHSLSGVDLEVPLGQNVSSTLTLPCDITRVVKLYCTHPKEISFPEHFSKQFTLVPGRLNIVDFRVRSTSESQIRAQINCVDCNSQELVYAWFVKLITVPQPSSATYEIKCLEGRETKQLLTYVNQTNYLTTFLFNTSHPQHLKIVDEKVSIGPMDKGEIRLRILSRTGLQYVDARIFIQDKDERIFDTISLKITYVTV